MQKNNVYNVFDSCTAQTNLEWQFSSRHDCFQRLCQCFCTGSNQVEDVENDNSS